MHVPEVVEVDVWDARCKLHWEAEYVRFMLSVGLVKGQSTPCLFCHPGKDITAMVYGDDFTILGAEPHLNWFKAQKEKPYAIDLKRG